MHIAIIDYDSGNIHSVQKALEHVAPDAHISHTSNSSDIANADKIVFPGQGAMGSCMTNLRERNLITSITKAAHEKPFLGICLGLQLLFDKSEEQDSTGLGIISGNVRKIQPLSVEYKIPHMGWNTVSQTQDHPLWHNIPNQSYFYSVHSYIVHPTNTQLISGTSEYGSEFCCSIAKDNIFAVQFHPEKSGDNGLQLLQNFIHWQP